MRFGVIVFVVLGACGFPRPQDIAATGDDVPDDAAHDGKPGTDGAADSSIDGTLPHFSFFVTSINAMRMLSNSVNGFGGDLRFGETGAGAGLRGADKICTTIAEMSMAGSGAKDWRAFLSITNGPVHARDRIGPGPWYDRMGRLVASDLGNLLGARPTDADAAIKSDLPNETGTPNHDPDGTGPVDNHDVLTGSDANGMVFGSSATCGDWELAVTDNGLRPRTGAGWVKVPGSPADNWISGVTESGCAAGVNLIETGPPNSADHYVGSGGGYGAIYCFARTP